MEWLFKPNTLIESHNHIYWSNAPSIYIIQCETKLSYKV